MASTYRVTVDEPDRLHLAGQMVASLLRRSCADPARAAKAARLRGPVNVDAGGMRLVLDFGRGEVRIRAGAAERPRASVAAALSVLLDVALGRGLVGHVLRRRVRVRGSPLVLWRMIGLMRARG